MGQNQSSLVRWQGLSLVALVSLCALALHPPYSTPPALNSPELPLIYFAHSHYPAWMCSPLCLNVHCCFMWHLDSAWMPLLGRCPWSPPLPCPYTGAWTSVYKNTWHTVLNGQFPCSPYTRLWSPWEQRPLRHWLGLQHVAQVLAHGWCCIPIC